MNIDGLINIAFTIILSLIVMKSLIIGSDFSLYYWFKHGKRYVKWYSKEFKGCGNGHYYLALDATHTIFVEDD